MLNSYFRCYPISALYRHIWILAKVQYFQFNIQPKIQKFRLGLLAKVIRRHNGISNWVISIWNFQIKYFAYWKAFPFQTEAPDTLEFIDQPRKQSGEVSTRGLDFQLFLGPRPVRIQSLNPVSFWALVSLKMSWINFSPYAVFFISLVTVDLRYRRRLR